MCGPLRSLEDPNRSMVMFYIRSPFSISHIKLYLYARTKDGFLEILFYDGNQVDDKIVCGLGEGKE